MLSSVDSNGIFYLMLSIVIDLGQFQEPLHVVMELVCAEGQNIGPSDQLPSEKEVLLSKMIF